MKKLLAYGFYKEIVTAIMTLYKITKASVHSPDGDTDFFDIVTGVLQGDTLTLYLFILCLYYVLRISIDPIKENGFIMKMTDADFADLELLANTPAKEESLLYSSEQAAGDIGLYMNANKIEYMCFKQKEAISTLSGKPLKLVDKFTYFGNNISSIESNINARLEKSWNAIDRLSIKVKSDLSGKIKQDFFQAVAVSTLLYGCTLWTLKNK